MLRTLNLFIGALLLFALPSVAQQMQYPAASSRCEMLGTSRPLTDIQPLQPTQNMKTRARKIIPKGIPNFTETYPMPTPFAEQALPKGGDPLASMAATRNQNFVVEPEIVVEGLDESRTADVGVPDPNGDISGEFYVQTTNSFNGGTHMVVYDLAGNQLFELENLNAFWAEFNVTGLGDPVVLFDHDAGRWVLTEFADFGDNAVLIAISDNGDPTGSWTAFRYQAQSFPDYPKYGVWNNAYYLTTNEFDDNIPIYVFDRTAMLNGEEDIEVQVFGLPKVEDTDAFQVATPVDWDGPMAPPAGSPGMVVRMYDDAWGGGQDKVELWDLNIDWDDIDNSFLSGPLELFTSPFDASLCDNGNIFSCLPHPSGQLVSALQHVIMHRVPYINFGTHESIVLQFVVDTDGNNKAGIRWMELRREGNNPWYVYQEGTHAPDDPHNRFMGSIGMDLNGNIMLAYTVGSIEKAFSLAFTGRLSGDPLGEMTIEEYEFATGLSSGTSERWGDYASMSIDPANGTDFWFTGEYRQEEQWGTKIMMARINRDSNDVGVQQILNPQNSGFLTDSEPLTVRVRNYGFKPQSDISVSFSIDGSAPVTELITDTIPEGGSYEHTFTPTVDLSVIGNYNFVAYTSLASDTTFFNDTLRRVISKLPRNDVAIQDIDGISSFTCDSTALLDIVFRNNGIDTLFSAVITYQLNSEPPVDLTWDGVLAPGATEFLQVQAGPFQDGQNTFAASASMPNGVEDEGVNDDSRTISFDVLYEAESVTLNILTDFYPSETTWEITDGNNEVVYSGGPYLEAETLFQHPLCLPDDCFTLTIYDSFGDGMIGPPPGDVEIINAEGVVIAKVDGNNNFGSRIDVDFCADFECTLSMEAEIIPESEPGASDGVVLISPSNGIPNYEYSIDGGDNFQTSAVFDNLPAGIYEIIARDAGNCTDTLTVEIFSCMLDISAMVTNANDDLSDGMITVTVTGGIGPYTYNLDGGAFQTSNIFDNLPAGDYTIGIQDEQGCFIQYPVTIDRTVDASETSLIGQKVLLFPNPTDGFVRIEVTGLNTRKAIPVKVYDAEGKVVRHYQLAVFGAQHKGVLSMFELPNGTYYLRFVDDALPYLYPVVKQ
jgi:hypothetical protein